MLLTKLAVENDCSYLYVQQKRQTTLSKESEIIQINFLYAGAKMISCFVLGGQESLKVNFSKPINTSDLLFLVANSLLGS